MCPWVRSLLFKLKFICNSNSNQKFFFDIFKLGFAIDGDIKMLRSKMPDISYAVKILVSYLDLKHLLEEKLKKMEFEGTFHFPYDFETTPSLSNLNLLCFNLQMDKANTMSNWARRPLLAEQEEYATLDASQPVKIFECIRDELEKNRKISMLFLKIAKRTQHG